MELKKKIPFVLQQGRVLILYEELAEEIVKLQDLMIDDADDYDVIAQSLLGESKAWMLKMVDLKHDA